jgi:hypothetical protein
MPVNNPRGAERGLVCRVGDATALSCPPNKDGIFCWGGRKKPSAIDPEGALLTTRGRLASPTSAVRYIRREGRLWVKGGSRRQTDGGAGLPSAPEMPFAPGQLRSVPRADAQSVLEKRSSHLEPCRSILEIVGPRRESTRLLRQMRLLKVCPLRSEKSADERRGSEVAACVIFMPAFRPIRNRR